MIESGCLKSRETLMENVKRLAVFAVLAIVAGVVLWSGAARANVLLDVEFWREATVEDVRGAVAGGADVNARSDDGTTPLHYAAQWGEAPGVVEALLAGGANVHARDKENGGTPCDYDRNGILQSLGAC